MATAEEAWSHSQSNFGCGKKMRDCFAQVESPTPNKAGGVLQSYSPKAGAPLVGAGAGGRPGGAPIIGGIPGPEGGNPRGGATAGGCCARV